MLNINPLFSPHSQKSFFENSYEKCFQHFVHRSTEYKNLFVSADLEKYLFMARPWEVKEPWRHAGLLCVKHPDKAFTPEVTSFEQVLELFSDGHSIILPRAQIRWPAIAKTVNEMSSIFQCRVDANIYITPPGAQGFKAHLDMHDVFLLQTEGEKYWRVQSQQETPLTLNNEEHRSELPKFDPNIHFNDNTNIKLLTGERLYLPRGTIHEGFASDNQLSVHISFTIFPVTWHDLIEHTLKQESYSFEALNKSVDRKYICRSQASHVQTIFEKNVMKSDRSQLFNEALFNRSNALIPSETFERLQKLSTLSSSILTSESLNFKLLKDFNNIDYVIIFEKKYQLDQEIAQAFQQLQQKNITQLKDLNLNDKSHLSIVRWMLIKGLGELKR